MALERAEAAADLDLVFVEQAIANGVFVHAIRQPDGCQHRQFVARLRQDVQAQRLDACPQSLAMQLLATGLSRPGYVTATTIMGLENVLDQIEGWQAGWGRERGRDPQLYWVRVFGEPSTAGPWSWRFGGHHISVQHLVLGGRVEASSPAFLGANPAQSPLLGGHLLRPLGAAEDIARDLVRSLDDRQAARARISPAAPADIVSGNSPVIGYDADENATFGTEHHEAVSLTRAPKGIAAVDLTNDQQDQLRAVLSVFLGRIPDELAEREARKFAGDRLNGVHFAWAGGIERGDPHYYRLQGPRLLAEYDNTQRNADHIHTVWRDPDGDFGDDVLAQHRATFHRNG